MYRLNGKKVMELLKEQRKSQSAVAEANYMTSAHLNSILHGRKLASLSVAFSIAKALNIDINEIVNFEEE